MVKIATNLINILPINRLKYHLQLEQFCVSIMKFSYYFGFSGIEVQNINKKSSIGTNIGTFVFLWRFCHTGSSYDIMKQKNSLILTFHLCLLYLVQNVGTFLCSLLQGRTVLAVSCSTPRIFPSTRTGSPDTTRYRTEQYQVQNMTVSGTVVHITVSCTEHDSIRYSSTYYSVR